MLGASPEKIEKCDRYSCNWSNPKINPWVKTNSYIKSFERKWEKYNWDNTCSRQDNRHEDGNKNFKNFNKDEDTYGIPRYYPQGEHHP